MHKIDHKLFSLLTTTSRGQEKRQSAAELVSADAIAASEFGIGFVAIHSEQGRSTAEAD
jgi:hypothetical protein